MKCVICQQPDCKDKGHVSYQYQYIQLKLVDRSIINQYYREVSYYEYLLKRNDYFISDIFDRS